MLPSRTLTTWTPRDVETALTASDGGALQAAADLTAEIGRDTTVRGVRSTRTLGMLGLPLSWEGTEPEDWKKYAPVAEQNKLLQWGLTLGVGIAQILPDGSLETWHPRWLRQDVSSRQWYVSTESGEEAIEAGDGRWILYTPYGELEPWADGLWTALAIPWLVKKFAIHDRARASEVFGSAMIIGKTEGASETQRKDWLQELKGLSRSSRMVLPEGYSIDLLEAQGQTWGIYGQATEWADSSMTIAIAGQLVTTQGTSGFNGGDIHETISHSLIKFGADTFGTTLSEQYIKPAWGVDATPQWAIDPPSKNTQAADATKVLGEAITSINRALNDDGLKLDIREIVERHGIPVVVRAEQRPPSKIQAAPTDLVKVIKVDELRASEGLGPLLLRDGQPDPKGQMLISDLALSVGQEAEIQGEIDANTIAASVAIKPGEIVRCSIDASEAPGEFKIFDKGRNDTDHGVAFFTASSAMKILKKLGARDVMMDLEHLSLDPDAPNYDSDARAHFKLEIRDGALWAVNVRYTTDGENRIESKKQRYISPAFHVNKQGIITSLINVALTSLPAMVNLSPLIAANQKGKSMLPEQLLELLGLPPDATIEDVMAMIASMQQMVADAAADAGADKTADAADAAAEASEEVADAAAKEAPEDMAAEEASEHGNGDDEEEEEEKEASEHGNGNGDDDDDDEKIAASVAKSALREVRRLGKRLDARDRIMLMNSVSMTPRERKWLATQSLSVVQSFVKTCGARRSANQKRKPSLGRDGVVVLTNEDLKICNMTGISPDEMRTQRKREIMKGRVA